MRSVAMEMAAHAHVMCTGPFFSPPLKEKGLGTRLTLDKSVKNIVCIILREVQYLLDYCMRYELAPGIRDLFFEKSFPM